MIPRLYRAMATVDRGGGGHCEEKKMPLAREEDD